MNDPTPFERLQADNDDLRARLQLADERAFEQAANLVRLRSALRSSANFIKARKADFQDEVLYSVVCETLEVKS